MSNYEIGTGIKKITFSEPGLAFQGFMEKKQHIQANATTPSVELDLFSRAFIIKDDQKSIVLVIADIWSCTALLKDKVIEKLDAHFGANNPYRKENVQISGTHTHSGPGGYSQYKIYRWNMTPKMKRTGLIEDNIKKIVTGITHSILQAHENLGEGAVLLYKGGDAILSNCGHNRSEAAYDQNFDGASKQPKTEQKMRLLKFVKTGNRPVGMINWFPVHPTNKGQLNQTISGDNKGWAAHLFEKEMGTDLDAPETFVAAFANSNCGDVSGNIEYKSVPQGPSATPSDTKRMHQQGERQYAKAWDLFNASEADFERLQGPIDYAYKPVDFSDITIDENKKTFKPALGLATLVGSTEDGTTTLSPCLDEGLVRGQLNAKEQFLLGVARAASPFFIGFTVRYNKSMDIPTLEMTLKNQWESTKQPFSELQLSSKELSHDEEQVLLKAARETVLWLEELEEDDVLPLDIDHLKSSEGLLSERMHSFKEERHGHAEKPVVILARHKHKNVLPYELPLQILRIGSFCTLGVPAELTTVAGRRLRKAVLEHFGELKLNITTLALATYSNAYGQYITTRQEYAAQHYEGASTLYGPHTLEAYILKFNELAKEQLTLFEGWDIERLDS